MGPSNQLDEEMAPLRLKKNDGQNAQASEISQALNYCLQDLLFEPHECEEKEVLLLLREVLFILVHLLEVQILN